MNATMADTAAGVDLLTNPDALVAGWEALLAQHHHLHAPEVARMLGVPESALVAARIGDGALRLVPDLARLLAPIQGWGRVMCAFSNALGVHMPLGEVHGRAEGDRYVLEGPHLHAVIDSHAITDAYLFVEHDEAHGNTRSVQCFDAAGNAVLKVFIFHKTRFKAADAHLRAQAADEQSRTVQPSAVAATGGTLAASLQDPVAQVLEGTPRALLAVELAQPAQREVQMLAASALVTWRGALHEARLDEHMFHLHETDLRSHLRYAAITQVARTASGALSLNGRSGPLLRIITGGSS